jgi:hypothetical protein
MADEILKVSLPGHEVSTARTEDCSLVDSMSCFKTFNRLSEVRNFTFTITPLVSEIHLITIPHNYPFIPCATVYWSDHGSNSFICLPNYPTHGWDDWQKYWVDKANLYIEFGHPAYDGPVGGLDPWDYNVDIRWDIFAHDGALNP